MKLRLMAKGTLAGLVPFRWTVDVSVPRGKEMAASEVAALVGARKFKSGAVVGEVSLVARVGD